MKKIWGFSGTYIILLLLSAVSAAMGYFVPEKAFPVSIAAFVFSAVFSLIDVLQTERRVKFAVSEVAAKLSTFEVEALPNLKIPVLISILDEFVWYNKALEEILPTATDLLGQSTAEVFGEKACRQFEKNGAAELEIYGKNFFSYYSQIEQDNEKFDVFYLIDVTDEKRIKAAYENTRPVVALVAIDNLDEVAMSAKDSELGAFKSRVQNEIEAWVADTGCISRRFSSDRYIMIFEESSYKELLKNKFDILEKVRKIKFGELNATLSIGVGKGGATLYECEELARQALDMVLGRGGDQAAISMPNNEFKFFGGITGSVQKRTRVRARIIASTVKELISACDNVVLMGHKCSDLDCVGACIGLYSTVVGMGKEAYIVIDRKNTMAHSLLTRLESSQKEFQLTDDKKVLPFVTRNTLLIVVDTHRPSSLECREIYDICDNVVVIDHHRRAVDYINDAVIFYNEPAASSACEMVTELVQYINPKSVAQFEAEALLSGIMLDTRNFVMHTGVRTFEASAFLRDRGADPIAVKKLFSGSMKMYQQRAEIVASAEKFERFAVAVAESRDENTRIAAAQAADELLGINGISASFVLCRIDEGINISARSLGSINVQLIMEALGGGGHRTMAACQVESTDFAEVKEMLIDAVNNYMSEQSAASNNN